MGCIINDNGTPRLPPSVPFESNMTLIVTIDVVVEEKEKEKEGITDEEWIDVLVVWHVWALDHRNGKRMGFQSVL